MVNNSSKKRLRLLISTVNAAVLILLGILSFQTEAIATSTPNAVRYGIGAVNDGNGSPITAYIGFDGNLWSNSRTTGLINLGTPNSTVGIASTIGIQNYQPGIPEIYLIGTDGNLWRKYWNYPSGPWLWSNLGTPDSTVGIASTVGIETYQLGCTEIYVIGTDGNLWRKYWNYPSGPWLWSNLGTPSSTVGIASTIGIQNYQPGNPEIYVIGTDGNLWRKYWNYNSGPWMWANLGTPSSTVGISSTIGIQNYQPGNPEIYVIGTDGNLWRKYWNYNSGPWMWANLGTPSSTVGIASTIGVHNYQPGSPEIYVIGTDGNLWRKYWNYPSGPWMWSNLDTPSSTIGIAKTLWIQNYLPGSPEIYVLGADGNLWRKYWNYGNGPWMWSNLGTPSSTVGIAGTVGHTLYNGFPSTFTIGTDSNLWSVTWDGSSWNWTKQTDLAVALSKVYPKYKILGLDYAPPGSASTVKYDNSFARTTSSTISQTFSVDVSVSASWCIPNILTGDITASYSQQNDSSTTNSVKITNSSSNIVRGPISSSLGVDHNADIIWLWLNPGITLTVTGPSSLRWGGYTTNPSDPMGTYMDIVPVTVAQLKGLSSMPAGLQTSLARSWDTSTPGGGGLTSNDYAEILTLNPFANGSYDPNSIMNLNPDGTYSQRYTPLSVTVNYVEAEPGFQPVTQSYSIQTVNTNSRQKAAQATYKVGYSYTISDFLGFNTTKLSQNFATTDKWSSTAINESSNTATCTITPPSSTDNYTGPASFQVWRDNIYGSLMFYSPVQ